MKTKINLSGLVMAVICSSSLAVEPPTPRDANAVPAGLAKSDWQGIRAAYEAGRHAFMPTDTGWQARNPGQRWTTRFDGRGFEATPREGDWTWGLELRGYGFGEHLTTVGATPPRVKAEGQLLTYDWDSTVREWWKNDQRGLEHGYVVNTRPTSDGSDLSDKSDLAFLLATRGNLRPRVSDDALGVEFTDAAGTTVLNYSGLKVWDADGQSLTSRFEPAGDGQVRLRVDERRARYPITVDPIAQQSYLKPSDVGTTQTGDQFGFSVAISGNLVAVGAPREDSGSTGINSTPTEGATDAGAVYVFLRSAGVWTQEAYLKPASVGSTQAGDQFGFSVSISPEPFTMLAVGAPQEDGNATGVNGTRNELANNSGAVYLFERNAGVWTQRAYLKPAAVGTTQAGDLFGSSVSMATSGRVVIGAPSEDGNGVGINGTPNESAINSGAAYVFVSNSGAWSQEAYLKPASVGTTQGGDAFGTSVAISTDSTVVVGAPAEDSSTTDVNGAPNESASSSGAAYVYVHDFANGWSQQAFLKPASVGTDQIGDAFGTSVSISAQTVVVGAPSEDSGSTGINATPNESAVFSGAAYVFARDGATWMQQAHLKPGAVGTNQSGDNFGTSVSISGDTVAVGAHLEDGNASGANGMPDENSFSSGAVYVYVRGGTSWVQQAYLKPAAFGTSQSGDNFGRSVAVSGSTLVVGAPFESSNTTGINSIPNDGGGSSGASYILTGLGPAQVVVQYPPGANLTNGMSTVAYGIVSLDNPLTLTFALRNSNLGELVIEAVSITGGNAGDFMVDTQGMATNLSPGASTTFKATFAPTAGGVRATTLRVQSNDPDEPVFDVALTGSGVPPDISVEQPAGTVLSSGVSTIAYGATPLGDSLSKTFTLKNTGPAPLTITSVATTGGNPGDFGVNTNGMTTTVAGSGSTTFTVTFAPSASGSRTTTLRIHSDDPDASEAPYSLSLTGTGLALSSDTDGDGLNDLAEFHLSPLGFDWQVSQASLVTALMDNAAGAGLFTPAQLQTQHPGATLIQRNEATGMFTLTLGLQKSSQPLAATFTDFPLNRPGITHTLDALAQWVVEFLPAEASAYFRLEAQ